MPPSQVGVRYQAEVCKRGWAHRCAVVGAVVMQSTQGCHLSCGQCLCGARDKAEVRAERVLPS